MCDTEVGIESDLNMTGRLTLIKTSLAALDICNNILAEPQVIGVKIVGRDLGTDKGTIYIIAFAKCNGDAYLFDLKLNPAMMKNGHIKHVLETITVVKVMHRSRPPCLTVFKEFQCQIQNVFDTEIAHTIIEGQKLGCSPFEIALPNISFISDYYGCGLKNKYRDRIYACLRKNKNFFAHRPLSKPTAEFVAAEAALLVPLIFSNMDQMINPCNRWLFNKFCSARIRADNEHKLRQNKINTKPKVKKLKEKQKTRACSEMCKKPADPPCKKCGRPRSSHPQKKSENCPKSTGGPKCSPKTSPPCSCSPSATKKSKKRLKCEMIDVCSRGVQYSTQRNCTSQRAPSCVSQAASTQHCTCQENCQPCFLCYGHTEDVPTAWQLVQMAGMDQLCLKKTHPDCALNVGDGRSIKCSCCDVACNTEESTPYPSSSSECTVTTDDCMDCETDSEMITIESDEECSDDDSEYCSQSEEESDLC